MFDENFVSISGYLAYLEGKSYDDCPVWFDKEVWQHGWKKAEGDFNETEN